MASVQESTTIDASPERAWEAVTDFPCRSRWSPRVKEAYIVGTGPLQVGTRIVLRVDRNRFTPVVTEMRVGERLALLVRGPGFRAAHVYEVRPAEQGATVTLTVDYGGPLGLALRRLMRRGLLRDLRDDLAAIKAAAEAPTST